MVLARHLQERCISHGARCGLGKGAVALRHIHTLHNTRHSESGATLFHKARIAFAFFGAQPVIDVPHHNVTFAVQHEQQRQRVGATADSHEYSFALGHQFAVER
jgi:hypothetical protein